jgi:hypothetical protein
MSKPTHTVMMDLNGNLVVYKVADVPMFEGLKGTSEYKCNKIVQENMDAE